jgi:hypothetical protein
MRLRCLVSDLFGVVSVSYAEVLLPIGGGPAWSVWPVMQASPPFSSNGTPHPVRQERGA